MLLQSCGLFLDFELKKWALESVCLNQWAASWTYKGKHAKGEGKKKEQTKKKKLFSYDLQLMVKLKGPQYLANIKLLW